MKQETVSRDSASWAILLAGEAVFVAFYHLYLLPAVFMARHVSVESHEF